MREPRKKLKLGVIIAAIALIIISIFMIVNAGKTETYVVDVINAKDTDEDAVDNGDIKIHKQIVKDNRDQPWYDDKNLTYEVKVSNVNENKEKTQQISVIIDTSYSTPTNDEESKLKETARAFTTGIYSYCPRSILRIYNAGGIARSSVDSVVTGEGGNVAEGLKKVAKESFYAGDQYENYIILFTDATDFTKDILAELYSNDIKVIVVLVDDITSNSYDNSFIKMVYSSDKADEEKLNKEKEYNLNTVYNIINSSLVNVNITDTFSEALSQYFDFELISMTNGSTNYEYRSTSNQFQQDDEGRYYGYYNTSSYDETSKIKITDNGYIWTIDTIRRTDNNYVLKFRLNMKEHIKVETRYKYYDLATSDSIVANYEKEIYKEHEKIKDSFTVKKTDTPTIKICEKYSVTFKAVSEENTDLPIEGIQFQVKGEDKDGNTVYNQTLTTNYNGEVVVDNLKTEGKIHFTIIPIVNGNGYTQTDTVELDVLNDQGTDIHTDTPEFIDLSKEDVENRNLTIKIPINTKKFQLEINLSEKDNPSAAIANTKFRLIQPKLNNKYDMQAKFGETDIHGKLIFSPTTMTKGGEYEYVLTQMSAADEYISMGNVNIKITFDNYGNVTEVRTINNDKVKGELKSSDYVLIKVENSTEKENMFNFELQLTDADDNTKKLQGSQYDIEVTRESAGTNVTTTYNNNIVDENGRIDIDLPGSGNVQIKLTQTKARTEYNIDPDPKVILLERKDGFVTKILQANRIDATTSAVTALEEGVVTPISVENKVLVKLTNKIKNERNIIEIDLHDNEEPDIKIPNINLKLVNDLTGQEYTATTDADGIARFQIDDQEPGVYPYTVTVDGQLPNIYVPMPEVKLSIQFTTNKHIYEITDAMDSSIENNPIEGFEPDIAEVIDNNGFADYHIKVNLGAIISEANTYWFQVHLQDEVTGQLIEGAKYDITITSGEIVRTIKGRKTNKDGNIETRLILNEDITIEVTQVESTEKYKIDHSTKEIGLKYRNSRLEFVETPSNNNPYISGNRVIYNHTNRKKSSDDVLLDLTIIKLDKLSEGEVSGLPIRIYQESQGDNFFSTIRGYEETNSRGEVIKYGSWIESSGEGTKALPDSDPTKNPLDITTKTDEHGTVVLKGIKVNNVPVPGAAEFIFNVVEVDSVTKQDKKETLVKYKVSYRYNDNKEIIEITNVETTYGNRLIAKDSLYPKRFDGVPSDFGYQSNIWTTIYSNYDDVGNLALDFKKVNQDDETLTGAEYKLNVIRPDGSRVSRNITVQNGDEEIELEGILVSEGSQIELTETKAPLGFGINEATEIIKVVEVEGETKELKLELESNNYAIPRIAIEKEATYDTKSGLKTQYGIKFTDYELDDFQMKIIAIDSKTQKPVPGYKFDITSVKGATKTTNATNNNGEVKQKVGGHYNDKTSPITYNISQNTKPDYYKDMTAFNLDVYFNKDEEVDEKTPFVISQPDINYGTLADGKKWNIRAINQIEGNKKKQKNDIVIEVYVEKEDPLEVEIITQDELTKDKVSEVEYKITPSIDYSGKGKVDEATQNTIVEVGYVERGRSVDYKLITTKTPGNYESEKEQTFTVIYNKDGTIDSAKTESKTMTVTLSADKKKVVITNNIQPRQGIQIVNNDYFTKERISGAEFKITPSTENNVKMVTGIGSTLGVKNGDASTPVRYDVKQVKRAEGYATIPDFTIEVQYNTDKSIARVELVTQECKIWVNPLFISGSSSRNEQGYNGNDYGIVKIEINSYYDFRINIENVDRLDTTQKIPGTNYEATSSKVENGKETAQTGANGIGTVHFDEIKINSGAEYTIHEVEPALDYQPLEIEKIKIQAGFDKDGFVIPSTVKVVLGEGDEYSTATGIEPVVNATDKFTINVQITNLPKFRMNITNKDYFEPKLLLSGTQYTITSEVGDILEEDTEKTTDDNGQVTLRVNGNPINTVVYTIHETKPSNGYQTLEEDVKVQVVFNGDGTVYSCDVIPPTRSPFATAVPVTVIVKTSDRLSIDVEIRSIELLKFKLTNVYEKKDSATGNKTKISLSGAKYQISAKEKENTTEGELCHNIGQVATGVANITMDRALSNKTIVYTITEQESAPGYKSLDYEIVLEITFDYDGKIKDKKWQIVAKKNGDIATNFVKIINVDIDEFTVSMEIKSVELLKLKIDNYYEKILDEATMQPVSEEPLSGAKYNVTVIEKSKGQDLGADQSGQTADGTTTLQMDRGLANKTIQYVIKEEKAASNYKKLDCEIILEVTFDEEGRVVNEKPITPIIVANDKGETSENFADIVSVDVDNFSINIKIRSNELLDFILKNIYYSTVEIEDGETIVDDNGKIVKQVEGTKYIKDGVEHQLILNEERKLCKKYATEAGRGFKYIINAEKVVDDSNIDLDVQEEGTTEESGEARISVDRALANSTIRYTIKEDKKVIGFQWLESDIVIEVKFDNKGYIVKDSWKIVDNDKGENASYFTNIVQVKRIENEIYLEITQTVIPELGIHLSAIDMYTNNPINDVQVNAYLTEQPHGSNWWQSYKTDGKYDYDVINRDVTYENPVEGYKNLFTGADRDGDGNRDVADGEDYQSMGKYMGKAGSRILRLTVRNVPDPYQYYRNDNQKGQEFIILVDVVFDDSGRPKRATLRNGGEDINVGKYKMNDKYISSVYVSGYTIGITMKFYPMLYVQMQSQDMYTGEVLESKLTLSTSSHGDYTKREDTITEGYIGDTKMSGLHSYRGSVYSVQSGSNYKRAAKAENNRTRKFYIYEDTIPKQSQSYYQKYRPKNYPHAGAWHYRDRLIGTIDVMYNEDGTIKDAKVTMHKSSNRIKEGFIELDYKPGTYKLQIKIKYAPTTKMKVTYIDRVTGTELNNINVYPFKFEGTKRYQYMSYNSKTETTDRNGKANWTYWEPNEPGKQNTYIIGTTFNGAQYNGYYLPGDVKVDVGYNENGRISTAQVLSNNTFGDALNAEVEKFEDTTLYLTIKLDRKFNLQLDKKDIYNANEKLNVKFKIESNENESTTINAWKATTVGRIHAGDIVDYTISEDKAIDGYSLLENLVIHVQYNDDGTIVRAWVDEKYEKYFEVLKIADADTAKNSVNKTDLEIIVKNVPTLTIDAELSDAFYNILKLEGAIFTITNDKGETASGTLITNSNGKFSTTVGEIYASETITYTITQTTTPNGYSENREIAKFAVHYNENGYIDNYYPVDTYERYMIEPEEYNGGRSVKLDITNVPKDVNIGIVKTDENTGEGIADVQFKVNVKDVSTSRSKDLIYRTQSDSDGVKAGTVSGVVDDVEKSTQKRAVIYTITEIKIPKTYRKIQNIELQVWYNEDGSISTYDVLSNESEVGIKVYPKGSRSITKLNGLPVHIDLDIKNDNRYDLIVKNEDINFNGLGINGTKYDVAINGQNKNMPVTGSNGEGITGLYKLEGSGDIEIVIAEKGVGDGYRDDNRNDVTIKVHKGESEYSLALLGTPDSNTHTYNDKGKDVTVVVDEERGTITVTFKNETKLELDMVKNNYSTKEALEDIKFEITSQEVNSYGQAIGVETVLTKTETTGDKDSTPSDDPDAIDESRYKPTDEEGKLHFDLGVTPQQKIMVYTFKELNPPEGYDPIPEIKITVEFNRFGQIEKITKDSYLATATPNEKNHNGIVVIIGNEEIPEIPEEGEKINPSYTIKVATEDSVTNKRINNSKVKVMVTKADNTVVVPEEEKITEDRILNGFLIEKGVIELSGITAEGDINISIDQIEAITGYEFSDKTSGTIKLNVQFVDVPDSIRRDIKITPRKDSEAEEPFDGFEVIIDNINREITVEIKNDPAVTLNINKYYTTTEIDERGNIKEVEKPIEGVKFIVTAEQQTSSEIITVELNKGVKSKEIKSTDGEGNTTSSVGIPRSGKTIIYTLQEVVPEGYEKVEPIQVLVKYDSSGNIKYTEVLSDEDVTKITESGKGKKKFGIKVKNIPTTTDRGYRIVLVKHSINNGEYGYTIPEAHYEISIKEEYGTEKTWTDWTNEDGEIYSGSFNGYGRIGIKYQEIDAPNGYLLDSTIYDQELYRDKATGELSEITSGEGFKLDTENQIIYLHPQDDLESDRYNIIMNKIDATTNKRITKDVAEFELSMFEKQQIQTEVTDEDGNIIIDEDGDPTYIIEEKEIETLIGKVTTDKEGKAKLTTLKMPEEEGTYKIKISETKTPKGYKKPEELFINATFKRNDAEEMKIIKIENLSKEYIDVIDTKEEKQVIAVNIKNIRETEELNENEFKFDITKIDSETKEAITEDEAIFTLTDEKGNKQYIGTDSETGKLEISYIEMPGDSEFENEDGSKKETIQKIYELKEVKAPKGYLLDDNPIKITITFGKDADNKTIIKDIKVIGNKNTEDEKIESSEDPKPVPATNETTEGNEIAGGNEIAKGNEIAGRNEITEGTKITEDEKTEGETEEKKEVEVTEENRVISFNIENKKGTNETKPDDKERGRYTINILKVDEETGEPVTGHATFVVTLEKGNGQIVTASTDENGKIQIKDIKVPTTVEENPGPYTYFIEERKAADGYELIDGYTVMELTFEETSDRPGIYRISKADIVRTTTAEIVDFKPSDEVNLRVTNTKAKYKITYDANCDDETVEVPKDQIKTAKQDIDLDKMVPKRDGYVFIGWSTEKDATTPEYQPGDKFTKDENTTLYAIWKSEFVIKYDKNCDDEVQVPADQIKKVTEDLTLDSMIPERPGYKFLGWSTDKDAETPEYQPGDKFTKDEDTTLYAIWTKAEIIITYDKNCDDDVEVPNPQTKETGIDLKLDSMVPERKGYIFYGWAKDKDAQDGEYQPEDMFTDDESTTLYAIWDEELYIRSENYKIINAETKRLSSIIYGVTYDEEKAFEYNEGDKFIAGIIPRIYSRGLHDKEIHGGTSADDLKNIKENIDTNADTIKITKKQVSGSDIIDVEVTGDELVGTGMRIEFTKRKQTVTLEAVVPGDIVNRTKNKYLESGDGIWADGDKNDISMYVYQDTETVEARGKAFVLALDVTMSNNIGRADHMKFTSIHDKSVSDPNTLNKLKELYPWLKR